MSQSILLQSTADGSHTLYIPAIDEHYHSINGAIQESKHIFINAGLALCKQTNLSILEIGFGTGLNAFLTVIENKGKQKIHYQSLELYPLPPQIVEQLNYPALISDKDVSLFDKLHQAEWDIESEITPAFYLQKIQTDFSSLSYTFVDKKFDLIYFDAFAPDKQPEMWTEAIFNKLYSLTNKNGILVTYCAKGIVRRMMQEAGYIVERLAGPPGKREMLRATAK